MRVTSRPRDPIFAGDLPERPWSGTERPRSHRNPRTRVHRFEGRPHSFVLGSLPRQIGCTAGVSDKTRLIHAMKMVELIALDTFESPTREGLNDRTHTSSALNGNRFFA